jgi:hypothetical protein
LFALDKELELKTGADIKELQKLWKITSLIKLNW